MINATKLPLSTLPSKRRVCSKDAVTNEIIDMPSAINANKIMPTKPVIAASPK